MRSFLFGPGEQILDQIETICSQQDKFGNETKTFWFRFQNNIGTFVLTDKKETQIFLIYREGNSEWISCKVIYEEGLPNI
jgi:hypothetical protein